MKLWYENPAAEWMQALPVGCGRLGGMVFGDVNHAEIALDEETIWSGYAADNDKQSSQHLDRMRQLLFDGKVNEAREFAQEHFTGGNEGYGTHLQAGVLTIETGIASADEASYRRELDLETAVATTEYAAGGVNYNRQTFATYVDNVIVMRIEADKTGSVNLKVSLRSDRENVTVACQDEMLVLKANCHEDGVLFGISVKPIVEGGSLNTAGDNLVIENADAVTLLIDVNSSFRSQDYIGLSSEHLIQAAGKSFQQLKADHVKDHQELFNRMSFSLGRTDQSKLPTDVRLKAFQSGLQDNDLVTTFFQYGRYLTIASSRPGTLPSHLQGVWNDTRASAMAWTCDYHLDINTQQNYWPAEICNLSECHEALFDFIDSLIEPGRKTAKAFYNCPGWVAHIFTNLWGFTPPGYEERWGLFPAGGVWLAMHLADRYNFTEDETFLRERAYPVLKESAEFFLAFMVEEPEHGWLVACPTASPENVYRTEDGQEASVCAGPTCDRILLTELFEFCIKASEILDMDEVFRLQLEEALAKLPPYQISGDGRIQEWMKEYGEPEPNHRHTTHLLGLYPFNQISPDRTPELAKAADAVLKFKMALPDWEDTEWGRAWNISFYARLKDPVQAYNNIRGLLDITDKNLMTFSPPHGGAVENIFVLDGNAAGTAGIAEMLLQSYNGVVELLPTLPKEWPEGSIQGLRSREGYEIDIEWKQGKLKSAEIRSSLSSCCQIKYRGHVIEMSAKDGDALITQDGFEIRLVDVRDQN